MILKTLDVVQTEIWINNLDKLAELYNKVQKYYHDGLTLRNDQFKANYGKSWFQVLWYGAVDMNDVYVDWDGRHQACGMFTSSYLTKIDDYTHDELILRDVIRCKWLKNRKPTLSRLIKTWGYYAEKPFQISTEDLEMYYNIQKWHEELKEIAIKLEIYDEAFNLDEDCV